MRFRRLFLRLLVILVFLLIIFKLYFKYDTTKDNGKEDEKRFQEFFLSDRGNVVPFRRHSYQFVNVKSISDSGDTIISSNLNIEDHDRATINYTNTVNGTTESDNFSNNESFFGPIKIPLVIFCSYRPVYMLRLMRSLEKVNGLHPDSDCLFACQRTPIVSSEDITKTNEIIKNIRVCKPKTFLSTSKKRTAREFKKQWYNTMKIAFEAQDFFESESHGDVLFLEDDVELSPDALKVLLVMLRVKNTRPNIIAAGFGGWSGENLVNPHPDTVVIRIMLYFPGLAYAFNSSVWKAIRKSEILTSRTNDWSEAIAWMWPGRYFVVVPTLGRVWHIGERGLGKTGDGRKRRLIQMKPPWSISSRLMKLEMAIVNEGIRDMFGVYCSRNTWVKHLTVPCLCPNTKRIYPNRRHFEAVCVDNAIVYDKCIGRDQ